MRRAIKSDIGLVSDWGLVNVDTVAGRLQLQGAVQAFMGLPDHPKYGPVVRHAAQAFAKTGLPQSPLQSIQAFTTGDDFPASIIQVLEKFHQTTYYDTGWEEVFNVKDMTNIRRASFEISDITDGLTFSKTEIGERAKLYKMSGANVTVPVDMYSGGLHWHKTLFDDEKYWTLEDSAVAFRNKFYSSKAQDFYDLIDAIGATYDQAWATGVDSVASGTVGYAVQRDVRTMNSACVSIIKLLKSKGMDIGPNASFICLAPIDLKDRITNALSNLFQAVGGSPTRVQYNIRPVYTTMLAETDKYYIIFPKNKIIAANRMNLKVLADMNITSYSELAVGWARYGGVIGETGQVVRCSTA